MADRRTERLAAAKALTGRRPGAETVVRSRAEPELSDQLAPLDNLARGRQTGSPRTDEVEPGACPGSPISLRHVPLGHCAAGWNLALQPAGPVPVGEVSFKAALERPAQAGRAARRTAAVASSIRRFCARRSCLGQNTAAWLWRILPRSHNGWKPVLPSPNGQPRNGVSAPLAYQAERAVPSCASQLKLAGASLVELLAALKISVEGDRSSRYRRYSRHPSVRNPPRACFPLRRKSLRLPRLQPCNGCVRDKPKFHRHRARKHGLGGASIAGPQAPTLAGPSLPPQLLNFDHRIRACDRIANAGTSLAGQPADSHSSLF